MAVAFPPGFNVADYSRVKTRTVNVKLLHCVTEWLGTDFGALAIVYFKHRGN